MQMLVDGLEGERMYVTIGVGPNVITMRSVVCGSHIHPMVPTSNNSSSTFQVLGVFTLTYLSRFVLIKTYFVKDEVYWS